MKTPSRDQSIPEELANAASHGLGLLLAIAAFPVLMSRAAATHNWRHLLSAGVFSVTMMLLYLASCLYHAMPAGPVKRWLNRADHAAIFLFIAGSHTPFLLGALHEENGPALLALAWAAALCGAFAKMADRLRDPAWSTGMYLALGSTGLIVMEPMTRLLHPACLYLLFGGGAMYVLGAMVFHVDGRFRYGHFVWHVFVLCGSLCHLLAVLALHS